MAVVNGTDGTDFLDGTTGADTIFGNGGDDEISGTEGVDTIYGGDGFDVLNYIGASTTSAEGGVSVDLSLGRGLDGAADNDVISGIEGIGGTIFSDTLTGDSQANVLLGGGVDPMVSGSSGFDILRGGGGD